MLAAGGAAVSRPTKDEYFAAMARLVATRSTCIRRAVGCVLVDARGHVLSTGYNGVAMGQPHCNEESLNVGDVARPGPGIRLKYPHACAGAFAESGTALDACQAIHAEQNALLQCRDVWQIATCYCTTAPCVSCAKLLMSTSCERVLCGEWYPQADDARRLFEGSEAFGSGKPRVFQRWEPVSR